MTAGSGRRRDHLAGLLRFLLVGGLAALAYALTTAVLGTVLPHPGPWVAVLVWLAFIPPVYLCHARFSFRERQARQGGLALYALTQGLSLCIVAAASAVFARQEVLADTLVYLAASALAAVTSFLLNRWLVFGPARGG